MDDHARFLDAFSAALCGEDAGLMAWLERGPAPGLDVYRNTSARGAIDALAAAFPTVVTMTGEAWFGAAARAYSIANPPLRASLIGYGERFAAWLADFPPAADAPYLGPIAHFDRLWWEAYFAADAPPLDAGAFAALTESDLARVRMALHPAARLAACNANLVSLWLAHQGPDAPPADFAIQPMREHLLVSRPYLNVETCAIDAAAHAFFSACAKGRTLAAAAEAALSADRGAAFAAIIQTGLQAGAFGQLHWDAEQTP